MFISELRRCVSQFGEFSKHEWTGKVEDVVEEGTYSFKPVSELVGEWASQSVGQAVSHWVILWLGESVSQSVSESASQWISESASQQISESVSQCVRESEN